MSGYVLFDFAGTIAELSPSPTEILAKYINDRFKILVKCDLINRAHMVVSEFTPYSSVSNTDAKKRKDFYLKYNSQLLTILGLSHLMDGEEIFLLIESQKFHWRLKKGAADLFQQIIRRGYSIGIISNFDKRLERIVYEDMGLNDVIDYLHVSQVEGLEKPDPLFYKNFFKKYKIPIERSVYIGDSYSLDYLPTLKLNLNACLLDESGYYPYLIPTISKLDDFLPIVKKVLG